jgi:L-glutamine-phosphate cytidylyltransferase
MQAVILAAGRGTRLKPFTDKTPKTLLKVKDKTILEQSLDKLPREINEVIIVIGYL